MVAATAFVEPRKIDDMNAAHVPHAGVFGGCLHHDGCLTVFMEGDRWSIAENADYATVHDLLSCPAIMEAAKVVNCYGASSVHTAKQSDAEQAYAEVAVGDNPTWVRLPIERRLRSWAGTLYPVFPLRLALYGHPDASAYSVPHCQSHLESVGFFPHFGMGAAAPVASGIPIFGWSWSSTSAISRCQDQNAT